MIIPFVPEDPGLRLKIQETASSSENRVTRLEHAGHTYWLKKSIPSKFRLWHICQFLAGCFASHWRPTVNPGGSRGLLIEVSRMARFRDKGLIVPPVVGYTTDWLLLGDMGPTLQDYLKNCPASEVPSIVEKACLLLAQTHNLGLYHGRAKVNDMVLTPGRQVGWIDFEEDIPESDHAPVFWQARELWLFLVSLSRFYDRQPDIFHLALSRYASHVQNPQIMQKMTFLNGLIYPVARLLFPFQKHLSRDVRYVVIASVFLKKIHV
jgi:tRNA A-37 threonylcarbamoyl transferase component Bud32